MQGVRFTEEWLAQHNAKMAGHKLVSAVPAPVAADDPAVSQPSPKRKQKRPEQELQIAVVKFLHVALPPTWRVVHMPNGGLRSPIEAGIFQAMGLRAGYPDLSLIGPGRLVVAEAKAGKGKLRTEQEEWRDWFRSIGVPWFVFRSHDELVSGCVDAGVPLRVRAQ